jgi:hypothetical protein
MSVKVAEGLFDNLAIQPAGQFKSLDQGQEVLRGHVPAISVGAFQPSKHLKAQSPVRMVHGLDGLVFQGQ